MVLFSSVVLEADASHQAVMALLRGASGPVGAASMAGTPSNPITRSSGEKCDVAALVSSPARQNVAAATVDPTPTTLMAGSSLASDPVATSESVRQLAKAAEAEVEVAAAVALQQQQLLQLLVSLHKPNRDFDRNFWIGPEDQIFDTSTVAEVRFSSDTACQVNPSATQRSIRLTPARTF